jgi:hypothetical protein
VSKDFLGLSTGLWGGGVPAFSASGDTGVVPAQASLREQHSSGIYAPGTASPAVAGSPSRWALATVALAGRLSAGTLPAPLVVVSSSRLATALWDRRYQSLNHLMLAHSVSAAC